MSRAGLYNEEKVLFFADRDIGLHVDPLEEKRATDLHRISQSLKDRGLIEIAGKDDSGTYFRTTRAGKIALLELQIKWRTAQGKQTAEHVARLERITAEECAHG